ncbi:MAG: class I SAM-dependent methyltransferase [Acidimicrobiales bacterium]
MESPDRFVNRDQKYLRDVQYVNGDNLRARTQLHTKYATHRVPWQTWLQRLVDIPDGGYVLDVGCGTGLLWTIGWTGESDFALVLSDLSAGMVAETMPSVQRLVPRVRGLAADAQALPFKDNVFDVVIANQMLYHVPDPTRATRELARVLRPGGVLMASTVGSGHLRELFSIEASVFGATRVLRHHEVFGARSGEPMLAKFFGDVVWHAYDDHLRCTDADDVIEYICSTPPGDGATPDEVTQLRREVKARMADHDGVLIISKDVGAFIARR